LFIGLSSDLHNDPLGINNPEQVILQLEKEVQNRLSPPIKPSFDIQKYKGKSIIRVLIPKGEEPPYALDDYKIYVRDETETNIAVRDEIVTLVKRSITLSTGKDTAIPISHLSLMQKVTKLFLIPQKQLLTNSNRSGDHRFST
jgi:predicted HTH transcriptional regulator